jgi:anthranilate synthase component 2
MIIMIDNYDSFTYNLYQYIGTINPDIEVYRNDKITVDEVLAKKPDHIILSPGPGFPAEAGICIDLIKAAGDIPILGVCLGHQAIGEAFGGKIVHAPRIMHGKSDIAELDESCPLFEGLGKTAEVGRYHSLVIDQNSLPECLNVIAKSDDGCIMGVKHKQKNIYGIQFHPESVLTPNGMKMIENFLKIC